MKAVYLLILLHFSLHIHSQNVGIGTSFPAAPLHIKSNNPEILKLDGNFPFISFYHGAAYKGYLYYDGTGMTLGSSTNEPVIISANYNSSPAVFTPNGRLGLGILNPSERLDVNGNINLSGLLKVGGNAGASGQILTSNGTANPTWTNAALSNNVRFAVNLRSAPSTTLGDLTIIRTNYNLNPSAISIGASSITINQSGLYHFDVCVSTIANVSPAPTSYPSWEIDFFYGSDARLFGYKPMKSNNSSNLIWSDSDQTSIELYISAPATIRLTYTLFLIGATSYSVDANMSGHLISQ